MEGKGTLHLYIIFVTDKLALPITQKNAAFFKMVEIFSKEGILKDLYVIFGRSTLQAESYGKGRGKTAV